MKPPPLLLVRVELEGLPVLMILAASAEDEARVHAWLSSSAVRQRILEAVAHLLDDLGGEAVIS